MVDAKNEENKENVITETAVEAIAEESLLAGE